MVWKLLVLGILLRGKAHGYQINDYIAHATSSYTDLKKSTTYYTLENLEKDGYVEHDVERKGKRPERRVYEITENGRLYFLNLLRNHLRDYTRTYYEDDVSIAFMDKLPTAEVRQLLTEKYEKVQALINLFREHPGHGRNWHYVIRHNIAHLEADLAWLNDILSELNEAYT
jgi:DNA-binding PadR family transcriptional regulator